MEAKATFTNEQVIPAAITAIGDPTDEDFIAQLIDSQAWEICYRAVDQIDLIDYFAHWNSELPLVLLLRSDFAGYDLAEIVATLPSGGQIISLDSVPVTSHLIMTHLRSELRTPTFHYDAAIEHPTSLIARKPNPVITISGTSGSPGRSRLAISLACHYAVDREVRLWDAEGNGRELSYLWEEMSSGDLLKGAEIRSIPAGTEFSAIELTPSELHILDLGTFPSLADLASDRRWRPHLINYLLDHSDHLIYVVASSGVHLLRLEEFIAHFPKQLRRIPITYLLAPLHNSRTDRAIEERFRKLTEGERAVVLASEESRGRSQAMAQLLLFIDERN